MAEGAKVERTTSKRLFTLSNRQYHQAIHDKLCPNIVKRRFEDVSNAWGMVMTKHATYMAHAHPDDDEGADKEDEWIDPVAMEFNKSELLYNDFIQQVPKAADTNASNEIKQSAKASRFERAQLETTLSNLQKVSQHESSSADSIRATQKEMKEQLERYKSAQRAYLMLIDDVDEKEMVTLQKMQDLCINASIDAEATIQTKLSYAEDKTDPMTKATEWKLKRMDLPSFSGQIREYPRFKNDFNTFVQPSVKKGYAAYVLKQCLTDEALEAVKNVDDDVRKMWERLEDRYGRISKITDAIMYDIKMLKPVLDNEDKKFVEMVNCVERSYRELERIGMGSEISNSSVVGMIEEKLPKTIRTEWCLKVSDKDTTVDERDKFPSLLQFLQKHQRAIEYGSNELRVAKHVHFEKGTVNHAYQDRSQQQTPPPKGTADTSRLPSPALKATAEASRLLSSSKSETKRGYCWIHQTPQHDILECSVYMEGDTRDKMDLVMDHRACWSCLRAGHFHYDCFNLRDCAIDGCKMQHHPTLHDRKKEREKSKEGHVKAQFQSPSHSMPCLLQLMRVLAGKSIIAAMNVMWDSGATVCLITFKKARELGLVGKKVMITIVKVGGERELIESRVYDVPVHDSSGMIEYFRAYGIQKISSTIEAIEMDQYAVLLDVDQSQIQRPEGEVDMLIGLEYAGFHPDKEKICDHLVLFKNRFGCCLGGTHDQLVERTRKVVQDVTVAHAKVEISDFYENEAIGVTCTPRCGSCRCGTCPIGAKQYTLQQERELAMIENGMNLHDGVWVAKYPWIRKPEDLPNNKYSALAMLRSTEKRLKKDEKLAEIYTNQVRDMVERGVARKLQPDELDSYDGPFYYISHHEVINPDSSSTPCRLVFNSSAKFNNIVLNDFWAKGPNMMNNLLGVLLRFRSDRVAVAGDIRKMYHTIKIDGVDQQTHRFLWRDLEDRSPDVYVITSVSFGDKPAAAMAAVALKKTAEMNMNEYPEASETIIKNAYVDDIIDSFGDHEKAQVMIENMDCILLQGGFKIKEWRVSGQTVDNKLEMCADCHDPKSDSKILGIVWDSANDVLEFRAKLNFSPRHRKVRTEPDIKEDEVPSRIPVILTKRLLLSQVNGIHDPIGLASPFVVRAKILLRNLNKLNLNWDDPIPEEEHRKWAEFFTELFDIQKVKFERSTKPPGTKGKPVLVLFSDASETAYGACAYIRWETEQGYESRLLLAKSRLAPLKKITTVRLEMNGALLSARLREFIIKEYDLEFIRVYHLVDSEIVRAMIQKESYGFNTFTGVRVGEIQEKTQKDEWYWIEGSINIADIVSRGASAKDLVGQWKEGPAFLSRPEDEWPIHRSCSQQELPEQVVMRVEMIEERCDLGIVVDLSRFSSYDMLVRVTARVLNMVQGDAKRTLRSIGCNPNREMYKRAEEYLIRDAQKTIHSEIKSQSMDRLGVKCINGIDVVGSRLETWDECSYNGSNPVLLSAKSTLAQLYARKIHNECHLGVSALASKIRLKYWIVGLRQLLKSIKFHCVICHKLDEKLHQQGMGPLPSFRLKPAPAWSYTSIDMFGPLEIKGEVNKRTRTKGYGVIYNCMLSRAVHLDVATNYDTEAFLLALRRFIAIRGAPVLIWSDQGSQLMAASKELKQAIARLNKEEILEFGSTHHIDWKFSPPDAPWQNGCAEALIKSVKKSLKIAIGEQALTFSEIQTVLFEVASLVNERPIGRHPTSPEEGSYLSPNDLLLARSTNKIPGGPFNLTTSKYARHRLVQRIGETFWKRWTENYFPSLLIQQKWHTNHRNLQIGDIVLIQESGKIKGKWKLGRVVKADPSLRDGLVRQVDVLYKNPDSKSSIVITRAVQRVVVVHPVEEDHEPTDVNKEDNHEAAASD